MLWTLTFGSNTCLFYPQVDEKAESSPAKDKENEKADASVDDTRHHGNPLFKPNHPDAAWKTVEKKSQETKAQHFGEGLVSAKRPFRSDEGREIKG